ncbi:unnamed protein product [Rhizophagus irregularis]|nr:unnamed protein product [Rhizophagus irregularis]
MVGYWALLVDGKAGTERTRGSTTTSSNNKSINRQSLTKTLSLSIKSNKRNSYSSTKKFNDKVAVSYQINEKTYYYSHNTNDHTWYVQELLKGGKFGKELSSGTLENPYHILFTFKIYNKCYLYAQNLNSNYWYIQELLDGGILGKETSSGTWKSTYHISISFRTVDGRIYHYGHNTRTNNWLSLLI